jgi:flagellar biosynthesis/type III secretory pathway M-ring protein FliF/YscJ
LEEQRIEEEFDEKIKAEMETMSPAAREKRRMEVELERERRRIQEEEERAAAEALKKEEEQTRKRLEEEKKAEYDELLAYAIDYVGNNPKVVAGVFKEWLAGDAAKTNAANVAASGGNT